MTRVLATHYVHPAHTVAWDGLIGGLQVGDAVVLNPMSGKIHEAEGEMPAWADLCRRIHERNAWVLIYTPTGYGRIDAATIASRVRRAREWMPIDGVFFDEAPSVWSWRYALPGSWLRQLHGLARSYVPGNRGLSVWNPGTRIDPRLPLRESIWCTFEGPASEFAGDRAVPQAGVPPTRQAAVVYAAATRPQLDAYGWGYWTPDPGLHGNPYDNDHNT
ncbi:MAG: spherulation-specific family 4 protein [Cetobacterium sp.]